MRCGYERGCVRCRPRVAGPRRWPSHRSALRARGFGRVPSAPPLVLRVLFAGVGTSLTGWPRNRRSRHPGVGMALRLRRRPAFRSDRCSAHRLCAALRAGHAGAALPRACIPVSRRRTRRNRCHVAPARGRTTHATGAVRGLRPRRMHHGLGSPPSPAARNVHLTPRHALGDSGQAVRDGLTGWSRRHDSAHPPARARVVRGLLRLVGHPRFDHVVDWCGRTGTRSRSTSAAPTPGHRRCADGDRRDPRRSTPSALDPRIGASRRLAARRPGHRPRARSLVRHGPRGHPRGQARACRLVAAGRGFGRTSP